MAPFRSTLRSLDRRTLAIVIVVALIAALGAGIAAAAVLSRNSGSGSLSLTEDGKVDVTKLLAAPLLDSAGTPTTLEAIQSAQRTERGRGPTLVNLWQSTCTPCVAEMPLLDAAQHRHRTLTVIGVDPQEQRAAAQKFAAQTKITYPWALDPEGELFNAAMAPGLPTTVLLDARNRFVASHTGGFTSAAELDDFLAAAS